MQHCEKLDIARKKTAEFDWILDIFLNVINGDLHIKYDNEILE